jgi:hypothetical protein
MSPSWSVATSLHEAPDQAFVHPWQPLSACNLDTATAAAWNRGSIPIEFLVQCVHLAGCWGCCGCAVDYGVMCGWGHSSCCFSPTWCSLINFPAIRLLRRPGYTTHCEPPIVKVVKRSSKPGQCFFLFGCFFLLLLSLFFLSLFVSMLIFISTSIFLSISFYRFFPFTSSFHFLFCHISFSFALSLPF